MLIKHTQYHCKTNWQEYNSWSLLIKIWSYDHLLKPLEVKTKPVFLTSNCSELLWYRNQILWSERIQKEQAKAALVHETRETKLKRYWFSEYEISRGHKTRIFYAKTQSQKQRCKTIFVSSINSSTQCCIYIQPRSPRFVTIHQTVMTVTDHRSKTGWSW